MKRKIIRLMAFGGGVAVLVGVLGFLNWLPLAVQKDILREYRDIEEAKSSTDIGRVFVPSYFPQNLAWPPSTILAQGRPFPAVVMEFERGGGKDVALLISQAASEEFLPDEKIRFSVIQESVPYNLKGRRALLEVGMCLRNETCSGLTWKEGKYRIVVRARSTPFELIRIAESMLR